MTVGTIPRLAAGLWLAVSAAGCKEQGAVALPRETAAAPAPGPATTGQPPAASQPPAPAATAADPGAAPAASETAMTQDSEAFTGATEPHRRSTLMPKVGSSVTRVYVREGEVVAAGDPLVALDTADFKLRLAQAETGLEAAKVQLDATQTEYDRIKNLVGSKAAPPSQLDGVDAKLRGAKVGVRAAQVGVDMARKALADATIRAPFAGLVVKRHINEGEMATSMPPTPLITIEEVGILDVRVQIPAAQIARLHEGDPLFLRFSGVNKEVTAKVTRVVPALNPGTRTFSVIVELVNPDPELKSGLFVEARRAGGPAPSSKEKP